MNKIPNKSKFLAQAEEVITWIDDYFSNISKLQVKSQVNPGDILRQIPETPPNAPEDFSQILTDFKKIIVPGITHWQHPKFFAYFPANTSTPSILAEFLVTAMNLQCLSWEASPAATELEMQVTDWIKEMLGLPSHFTGCLQPSASIATLCAILTAREVKTEYISNSKGLLQHGKRLTVYCSRDAHSSIERAVRISGIGADSLRCIELDAKQSMSITALEQAITADLEQGFVPTCIVATLGTTSTLAIDPLSEIVKIAKKHNIWVHVDAAHAGTALLLPEYRKIMDGLEDADSFLFNPHKWMFTNAGCTAYYVRDKAALIKTFQIEPEYLRTDYDTQVNNYRDWGIELGRRFRALKLWFMIRYFGVTKLRCMIRAHITLAKWVADKIDNTVYFEHLAPPVLNLVCFRLIPEIPLTEEQIEVLNRRFMKQLNQSGELYLTHTKINKKFCLRFVVAQTNVTKQHVTEAWEFIETTAIQMVKDYAD